MSISIKGTSIPGCYLMVPTIFQDNRGVFVKTYEKNVFEQLGINTDYPEEFYSISYKNVLRGLHFQTPPHDLCKIVSCVQGSVLDVVVDLRVGSPAYGKSEVLKIDQDNANMVYIPPGVAHGFYVTSASSVLTYKVSKYHSKDNDKGIHWAKAGVSWPKGISPITSQRDESFPSLFEFKSPFIYKDKK